jgi:hypothetical protein
MGGKYISGGLYGRGASAICFDATVAGAVSICIGFPGITNAGAAAFSFVGV